MRNSRLFVLGLATLLLSVAAATAQPPGRFGGRGRTDPEQAALDRLRLTGTEESKAQRALDSHTRATRRMLDDTRQDLLKRLAETLTAPQLLEFKDGLNTGRGAGRGSSVSVDDMVERVMACDKNKSGKVAKEDLPERMQHLVALGDTNKDGFLDREEVKQLALKLGLQGRGRNQGLVFTPADAERSLGRLSLSAEQKDKSKVVLEAFKQTTRKVTDERREDLVKHMKDVLTEEQLKQFKDSLQTVAGRTRGPG